LRQAGNVERNGIKIYPRWPLVPSSSRAICFELALLDALSHDKRETGSRSIQDGHWCKAAAEPSVLSWLCSLLSLLRQKRDGIKIYPRWPLVQSSSRAICFELALLTALSHTTKERRDQDLSKMSACTKQYMEFSVAEVKTAYALSQERREMGPRSTQDGAARRGSSAIFTEWGLLKQKVSPPLLSQKGDNIGTWSRNSHL
jgi:hypothetical protein